jgi:hypothetical protein
MFPKVLVLVAILALKYIRVIYSFIWHVREKQKNTYFSQRNQTLQPGPCVHPKIAVHRWMFIHPTIAIEYERI